MYYVVYSKQGSEEKERKVYRNFGAALNFVSKIGLNGYNVWLYDCAMLKIVQIVDGRIKQNEEW